MRYHVLNSLPEGVFKTLSNIHDGAFCENSSQLNTVNYFRKTFHLRCLPRFWILLCFWHSSDRSTWKTRSRTTTMWDKVYKNGLSKICGRQPLKDLKGYRLLKADGNLSNFLKAVFQNIYLVHSWILCVTYLETFKLPSGNI